ncbi:hypothetical protein HOK51_08480 [Candidatus Woesearchaeota archaeon]|jgi:hypothetical protein|nr:hypothetical protein [Candidatus Woesearchaeota archaeon]MBT6519862.1 hypothetical protein [Candidatus Woesearchaeota archaeon]MBT7367154.1 hypothetical protein [Candidatus Woesearchaeota archaeon]
MKQTEIQKRNLIATLEDCLKEHQVDLKDSKGTDVVPMYLIEVNAKSWLLKDFLDTYKSEINDFKRKLADKILRGDNVTQKYGVLLNTNLKYSFAFNRDFADLDKNRGKIEFKDAEEYLLEKSANEDLSQDVEADDNTFPVDLDFDPGFRGGTGIVYSITGKRSGQNKPKTKKKTQKKSTAVVSFDKASLLNRVDKLYSKNKVKLNLSGSKIKSMILIEVKYKTSKLDDFMKTYEGDVDEFKEKIARKMLGDKKIVNTYGILLTPSLQMKYAFNTAFAKYDKESESIVYTPVEEVLLGETKQVDLSKEKPKPRPRPRPRPQSPTVFRYSLQGKKQ